MTTARPAFNVFLVLYALAFGLIAGLGSALWIVKRPYPVGRAEARAWVAWPQLGASDVDPYSRAILSRSGDIPIGLGEGFPMTATVDDSNRPLEARCTYRLAGQTPAARFWTLTLYGEDGQIIENAQERGSFTSAEIVRDETGRFDIVLARQPEPGNWLQMPKEGRVKVVLRLYDTPLSASLVRLDPAILPSVTREGCES